MSRLWWCSGVSVYGGGSYGVGDGDDGDGDGDGGDCDGIVMVVTMTEGRRTGTRKGVEVMDVARHSARGPSYIVANREENDGGFTGF